MFHGLESILLGGLGGTQGFLDARFNGLRFRMFGGLDEKDQRTVDASGVNAKEVDGLRDGAGLDHERGKMIDAADDFGELAERGLEFVEAGVEGGGGFEIQAGGGGITLGGDFVEQRIAAGVEIGLYAGDLGAIFVVRAALEAGGETHFHFGVNAAGEFGVGIEIVNAAAHFKEVERIVGVFFGSGAGGGRDRSRWICLAGGPIGW